MFTIGHSLSLSSLARLLSDGIHFRLSSSSAVGGQRGFFFRIGDALVFPFPVLALMMGRGGLPRRQSAAAFFQSNSWLA
jgi:hypothetical protein